LQPIEAHSQAHVAQYSLGIMYSHFGALAFMY
jgi:hypothetical protein